MNKDILFVAAVAVLFSSMAWSEQSAVSAPPAELNLDPFYTKYLDCDGICVMSSDKVDDRAFYRLRELLDKMLRSRPDLRQTLVDEGFRYIIISHEEQVTDIPEYAHMKPKEFWNQRARGFGGRTTSCGEENLLNLPEDRYGDESIFIHELAHGIHSPGLRKCDPMFQDRLDALYRQAMDKGLYQNDYASTNASEYWAESVQAFFDCDRQNNWNHNHINTREELIGYDPDMAAFVREIFRITDENDWRYKPLAKQPSVQKTPESLSHNGRLPKYVWCWNFSLFGTETVPDQVMLCAADAVRNMFCYRYDILKTMIDAKVSLLIYDPQSPSSAAMTGPRFQPESFVRQEGDKTDTVLPEQLQLTLASSALLADGGNQPFAQENLIHDLALAAYLYTGLRDIDPDYDNRREKQQYEKGLERMDKRFDQKVRTIYKDAMEKGLWKSTPAAENRFEYFAFGTAAFFDAGRGPVSTREQLTRYDPPLAALIEEVFKHPQRTDWRYALNK